MANKWIHEYGQEFLHPCSLKSDEWAGRTTGPLQAWARGMKRDSGSQKIIAPKQAEDWESLHLWLEAVVEPEVCSGSRLQMDSTRLGGVTENQWGGHGQSAAVAKCFLARAGRCLQNERGLCLRTQGWFQLTLLGSVPPETWNMDRLPYTGPSVRSAIANQISTTELVQKCYFVSYCRCLHRFLSRRTKFLLK